ncbi:S1C family serine protease [Planctomycetota bacterium]
MTRHVTALVALALAASAIGGAKVPAPAPKPPPAADGILNGSKAPKTIDDLKAMQERFRSIAEQVVPCTVGVRIGGGSGSGVIVSADGLVLTAAHVIGRPGRDVALILHDGRQVKGKTLGANYGVDAGMIKIQDKGPWPFREVGDSGALKLGAWCMATGHPAGYQPGRTPPVRVGRLLAKNARGLVTDCMLVGGDSGGPLFDMHGRIVGIHSRIGGTLSSNVHVPADTYRETWDRLAKGEAWGARMMGPRRGGPYIGVVADPHSDKPKIMSVQPKSPAAAAGIKQGDIITKFDGKPLKDFAALATAVRKKKPGNKVKIEIQRGDETLTLDLTIGKYPGPQR